MRACKHLAIRLSQPATSRRSTFSIIEAHNAVVREHGMCAFGKFGAQISKGTKDLIDTQVNKLELTYLYVILRQRSDIQAYRAKIQSVVPIVGKEEFHRLNFPGYYSEKPTSAIIISEELKESKIDDLIVLSSKRALLDAILSSRTPLMIVSLAENNERKRG